MNPNYKYFFFCKNYFTYPLGYQRANKALGVRNQHCNTSQLLCRTL